MKTFKEKLVKLKEEKEIEWKELAAVVGVSPPAINKWKNGTATPTVEALLKIAEYFNVSLDYLIRDDLTPEQLEIEFKNVENNIMKNIKQLNLAEIVEADFFILALIERRKYIKEIFKKY